MSKNQKLKQERVMPCDECSISNVCVQKEAFIKQANEMYGTMLDDIPFKAKVTCQFQKRVDE